MSSRALVYDLESGEIKRQMKGHVEPSRHVLDVDEGLLVDPEETDPEKPETPSPVEFGDIPASLEGKLVDLDTVEVVADPEYEAPRPPAAIAQDLRDGELSTEEALLEFLER